MADIIDAADPLTKKMEIKIGPYEFKILSYNLLNLFDTKHDEGRQDYTWLPLSHPNKREWCRTIKNQRYRDTCLRTDWNEEKLNLKLNQIKRVVDMQGVLPDLLAVQEIENDFVAQKLAETLGYDKFIITHADDKRGIEVALLYKENKLQYLEHEEFNVSKALGFQTRHILRAHFKLKSDKTDRIIGVYVNHWPSQASHPTYRAAVAKLLRGEINNQTHKIGLDKYSVILTGDFNTRADEIPNAFHTYLTSPNWDHYVSDAQSLSEQNKNPMTYKMPPGTYWYKRGGSYHKYDRILISQNLNSARDIIIKPNGYRILATRMNSKKVKYSERSLNWYGATQFVPVGYNFNTYDPKKAGFSDHYPVAVKFKFK